MASALNNRNNRSLFHIKICVKMNSRFLLSVLWCCLLYRGLSDVAADEESVSVKEGDSVTLHTGVVTNQQESIKWYFGDTLIAQITGDLRKICTDVKCKDGDERFRDRLKLDHQNGSLTIMNTRTTDSGLYPLVINRKNSKSEKIFRVTVHGPRSTAGEGTNATDIGGAVIGGAVIGAVVVGAVGVVLLIAAVPVVVYYRSKRSKKTKQEDTTVKDNHDEETGEAQHFLPEQNYIEMNDVSVKTTDQTVANGRSQ